MKGVAQQLPVIFLFAVLVSACCAPQSASLDRQEATAFRAVVVEQQGDLTLVKLEHSEQQLELIANPLTSTLDLGERVYIQGYLQGDAVMVTDLKKL